MTRVKVACLQFEPKVGQKERNVAKSLELLRAAKQMGATLCVLPELCNTGYVFESKTEVRDLAERVPDGPTIRAWQEFAKFNNMYLIAGVAEQQGARLYNTQAILGPDGFIGKNRKLHLWDKERLYFDQGDLGYPVFSTPIGKLSGLVCYEIWFPEAPRILAVQGADIICVSTNWIPFAQRRNELPMQCYLCMAHSHVNSIPVAAADRIGTERGQNFIGRSLITDTDGWPVAGPASSDQEEVISAELDLSKTRESKRWSDVNNVMTDRRTDVYDELLGYKK